MVALSRTALSLRDPEGAERALADYFPSLQLGRSEPGAFRSWISTTAGPGFSLVDYGFASPGSATAGSDEIVVITSGGDEYSIAHGRTVLDTSQPFLSPEEGLAARWETHDARVLMLTTAKVERVARSACGDDSFALARTGTSPISRERAEYWNTVVRGFRRTVAAAPEAFDSPLVAEAAFHQLATAFLHVFPTNWLERAEHSPTARSSSVAVRRAIEFMRAHPGEPITMQEVADAACISTRGLHYAFRRDTGEAPSSYLRRLRMEGARTDLVSSDGTATVAAVARRWGFRHVSRFAQAYRGAYGENPTETLRR